MESALVTNTENSKSAAQTQPAAKQGRPVAAPAADPALARIDGRWYSDEWKYGYTLRGGVGTATVSNSPNFKPGDQIIFLKSAGETRFVGEQIYKDGKFYTISVSLMPDGRLAFQGDRNVKWIMRRRPESAGGAGWSVQRPSPVSVIASHDPLHIAIALEGQSSIGHEADGDGVELTILVYLLAHKPGFSC